MIFQALRIHETTGLRHLKNHEQSKQLQPENSNLDSLLVTTVIIVLNKHFNKIIYHHTYQIIVYVDKQFWVQYTVVGMNKWLYYK